MSTNPAAAAHHLDDSELDDLRLAVLARIRPSLADLDDLDDVGCRLDRHGTDVVVRLTGPAISEMRRQAIAVRALDAVRSGGRTFGHVDVTYEPTSSNGPTRVERNEIDRNGLEVLGRRECLQLLDRATLGRVAVTTAALPTVLPVNFRLAGDRIVFRTGQGTKLAAATRNAVVAFEVDDIDPVYHTGWSVIVTGVARPVVDPTDLAALEALGIPRWAPVDDGHVVAVSLELVSGRRIPPGAPAGSFDSRPGRREDTAGLR